MGKRVLVALPLVVLLALAGGFYAGLAGGGDDAAKLRRIDRPVPAIELAGLPTRPGGKPARGLSRADLVGQVSLVNFFASWCAPCRREHAVLAELAARADVPLHGINYQDSPKQAGRFLAELGDNYARIGVDPKGEAAIAFGVSGVPETYIVDRQGRLRYRVAGPVTPSLMRAKLLPALAELTS